MAPKIRLSFVETGVEASAAVPVRARESGIEGRPPRIEVCATPGLALERKMRRNCTGPVGTKNVFERVFDVDYLVSRSI